LINIDKENDTFFILDKFIQIVLNLLKDEQMIKRRKLIIDYFNVYEIKLPKINIENNKRIENLITDKKEIFVNNFQEKDLEDPDTKENTIYNFTREKLAYEWFIPDIINLKMFIIWILDFQFNKSNNILFNKLNNKEKEDIKKGEIKKLKRIIFSYIFQENSNKYFLANYSKEKLNEKQVQFEKIIFE
jgi:hypothetical protein